jgi:hypothetical protein
MNDDERKTLAKLEYSIDSSGEIYIDILIEDYSESTINQFAALLSSLSMPTFQLQTLAIAQEAFTKDGKVDELKSLISQIIKKQGIANILDGMVTDEEKDDPLIKPTDLM